MSNPFVYSYPDRPTVFLHLTQQARDLGIKLRLPANNDAGIDLVAVDTYTNDAYVTKVETQLHVSIPQGYVGLIRERSSWANQGLIVTGGVIDSGYTGVVYVTCHNYTTARSWIEIREQLPVTFPRFAQLIVVPCLDRQSILRQAVYGDIDEDPSSQPRGDNGFGSTGQ